MTFPELKSQAEIDAEERGLKRLRFWTWFGFVWWGLVSLALAISIYARLH